MSACAIYLSTWINLFMNFTSGRYTGFIHEKSRLINKSSIWLYLDSPGLGELLFGFG